MRRIRDRDRAHSYRDGGLRRLAILVAGSLYAPVRARVRSAPTPAIRLASPTHNLDCVGPCRSFPGSDGLRERLPLRLRTGFIRLTRISGAARNKPRSTIAIHGHWHAAVARQRLSTDAGLQDGARSSPQPRAGDPLGGLVDDRCWLRAGPMLVVGTCNRLFAGAAGPVPRVTRGNGGE